MTQRSYVIVEELRNLEQSNVSISVISTIANLYLIFSLFSRSTLALRALKPSSKTLFLSSSVSFTNLMEYKSGSGDSVEDLFPLERYCRKSFSSQN
jgi:hypothetical protein